MLPVIVIVVILVVLAILYMANRMAPPEDEFRKRWGGSDARQTQERSVPCTECSGGGYDYDNLGECGACGGRGYILRDEL